jgi:hypothetical protein
MRDDHASATPRSFQTATSSTLNPTLQDRSPARAETRTVTLQVTPNCRSTWQERALLVGRTVMTEDGVRAARGYPASLQRGPCDRAFRPRTYHGRTRPSAPPSGRSMPAMLRCTGFPVTVPVSPYGPGTPSTWPPFAPAGTRRPLAFTRSNPAGWSTCAPWRSTGMTCQPRPSSPGPMPRGNGSPTPKSNPGPSNRSATCFHSTRRPA